MFKKYFDEYKKEIHYHQDYNNTIDFNQGVQHSLNTHLDIINYVEDDIMKMPQNKRREHFFYLMKYYEGEDEEPEFTNWFESISLSRKDFIEHILEGIELDFKEPLRYIKDYKFRKSKGQVFARLDINFFRTWLKQYFFNKNIPFSNDFYVNLQNAQPDYIIYNTLGEIDNQIMEIAKNKKEKLIQKIVKNIKYTPLSLKVMCWIILPIKVCEPLIGKIIL
jgi:hypothetical protein